MSVRAGSSRAGATVLALTLAIAVLLTLAPAAQAGHRPNNYCSPNGDFCIETLVRDGARRFRISALSFSGSYRLCVTGPDDLRECKQFTMSVGDRGSYSDSVRWRRHFTFQGYGAYHVSWRKDGERLGPILGFHKRPPAG